MQTAISTHGQGIDGPNTLGHGFYRIDPRQGLDLVWQGEVAACKTQSFQAGQGLRQLQRVDCQRHIGAMQPMLG